MVNILTNPQAASAFAQAQEVQGDPRNEQEGMPSAVYDYESSTVLKNQLKKACKATCHAKAPGVLGHVVLPGHISFYKKDGKTFCVPQGRWFLTNPKARWIGKNVRLDQEVIQSHQSQVLIIRVSPGSVGRVLDQGVPILLNVGTHVFNSGTVSDDGSRKIADFNYLSHGRFHYVRVDRGKLARVWAEVNIRGNRSVQPRLLGEGEHFVDSHLFKFDGMSSLSDEYIKHG